MMLVISNLFSLGSHLLIWRWTNVVEGPVESRTHFMTNNLTHFNCILSHALSLSLSHTHSRTNTHLLSFSLRLKTQDHPPTLTLFILSFSFSLFPLFLFFCFNPAKVGSHLSFNIFNNIICLIFWKLVSLTFYYFIIFPTFFSFSV